MESNRNLGPIIIIILSVAVAGGLYILKGGNNPLSRFFGREGVTPVFNELVRGELVAGFPEELILPSDATIESSSDTFIEGQARTVKTASYTTQSKLNDLFAAYLNYFAENNFEVSRSDSKPGASSIVARSSEYGVGVTITYLYQNTYRVRLDVNIRNTSNE